MCVALYANANANDAVLSNKMSPFTLAFPDDVQLSANSQYGSGSTNTKLR